MISGLALFGILISLLAFLYIQYYNQGGVSNPLSDLFTSSGHSHHDHHNHNHGHNHHHDHDHGDGEWEMTWNSRNPKPEMESVTLQVGLEDIYLGNEVTFKPPRGLQKVCHT
eukprot:UN13492